MKKIARIFAVLLIVVIISLYIGKNLIAKTALTGGVKKITGLEMDIGSMDVGIFKTLVDINEMKLYNPPEFSDRVMVDMPEIYVDYDLISFLKGNVHLEELRINLRELTVIKDKNGKLNINSLKTAKTGKEKEPEKSDEKKKTKIQIDFLDLKIGKVIYKDYSGKGKPRVLEYNLNLHEQYKNITDLDELGKLILVKALMNTNIAKLAGFAIESLESEIRGILNKSTEAVQDAGKKAADTLKNTAEEIKDKLKLPFGK